MNLMPTIPLHPAAIIARATTLYSQTFIVTLPFICLIVGLHFLIGVLPHLPFIPNEGKIDVLFMMGSILLIPLMGGLIHFQHSCITQQAPTWQKSLAAAFGQLLALILSLVYLSFIPLIIMSIGIASFLFLDPNKVANIIRLGILLGSVAIMLLFLANKILAPVLVVLEKEDANRAREHAATLTKGFYFQTLLLGLIPLLIMSLLFWIPMLLNITLSDLKIPFSYVVFQGAGDALLGLVAPWMSMIILLHINDLMLRKHASAS